MTAGVLLAVAIGFEVLATLTLSHLATGCADSPGRRLPLLVVVVLSYATSFGALIGVLSQGVALSIAYGIWAASGVALTALLSAALLGERITTVMAGGMALIAAGVALVGIGG